jgi:hypothetical protein
LKDKRRERKEERREEGVRKVGTIEEKGKLAKKIY